MIHAMKDSNTNNPNMASEHDNVSNDEENLKKYLEDETIPEAIRKMSEYLSLSFNSEIRKLRTDFQSVKDELSGYRLSVDSFEQSMDRKVTLMKSVINDQANEITLLKKKVNDQEAYSRRRNVILSGLPEDEEENLYEWFCEFVKDKLNITDTLELEVIHRLGRLDTREGSRPRDIIMRFKQYQDKIKVMSKRKALGKKKDEDQNEYQGPFLYLNDHYTADVIEKRRQLLPIAKEARDQGCLATVNGEILVIDGERYDVNTLDNLPESLIPISQSQRETETQIAFFRKYSKLSNHHPARFVNNGETYSCSEEFYLSEQCLAYGHKRAAAAIRATKDPAEMVKIAKVCKGPNKKWNIDISFECMKAGCREKFDQNPELKDYLLSTNFKTLVEGSKFDKRWGVGIYFNDPAIDDQSNWPPDAKNDLGRVLMDLRNEYCMEDTAEHRLSPHSTPYRHKPKSLF
jgi:hypothetical protein